jgi:membrane fusion protein (multidrug efflux system)
MKRWMLWTGLAALLALTVVKLVMNKRTVEERVYRHDKNAPVHVSVEAALLGGTGQGPRYGGTVVPLREGRVMAEVPGRVLRVAVREGQQVRQGDLIAQLDGELLRLQQESAQVQVAALEKDQARYRVLAAADAVQGIQLERTEQALQTARIQLANITEQLSRTTIRAPFDGEVTQLLAEEGTVVGPSMPVAMLSDPRELEVLLQVSEVDVARFQQGLSVQVTLGDLADPLKGTVHNIGRRGDVANRFPVRVELATDPRIVAGLSATVELPSGTAADQVTIAARALLGSAIAPEVYLVRDSVARRTPIVTAAADYGRLAVVQGLKAGDLVVTSGAVSLRDGARVTYR